MTRQVKGSVVVITGASSGIGRATAHRFAEQGATVVLAARRAELLEEAAAECRERGAAALDVPTDVTQQRQVEELARTAVDSFGRIDTWVNNAGVLLFGRFPDIPMQDFEQVLRVNVLGYVYGARAVLPYFRKQGGGVLINNASLAAAAGQPLSTPYVTAKWAVRGFSDALRMDLIDEPGIQVCTVMPGVIDTPLFQHAANYTGQQIQAPPPVFSPQRVADVIVQLARKPRAEIAVAGPARLVSITHTVAPRLTERRLARNMRKSLLGSAPAVPGEGNLYQPAGHADGVTGGWQQRSTSARSVGRAAAGAALLALPALAYAWHRSSRRD
jgi:NADP-dependent 3-hydroxy acid dehydrogenase YdfG